MLLLSVTFDTKNGSAGRPTVINETSLIDFGLVDAKFCGSE